MSTDAATGSAPARGGFRVPFPRTLGGIIKLLVIAAVTIFLFVYVGPSVIGWTALKIVLAVGISIGLFVGANLLFNSAYSHWNRFATTTGFIVGFLALLLLAGNRALRSLGPGPWLWALIGGAVLGLVMFLLTAPKARFARVPLAAVGLGAFGLLISLGVNTIDEAAAKRVTDALPVLSVTYKDFGTTLTAIGADTDEKVQGLATVLRKAGVTEHTNEVAKAIRSGGDIDEITADLTTELTASGMTTDEAAATTATITETYGDQIRAAEELNDFQQANAGADRQPSLDWAKVLVCTGVGIAIAVGRRLWIAKKSASTDKLLQSALTGGAVGWLIGAWGGATFRTVDSTTGEVVHQGGNVAQAIVATVIPLAVLGVAIGLRQSPNSVRRREIEQKSRAWIFLVPALAFIVGGLVAPLVRTVIQSFQANKTTGYVGFKNYYDVVTSKNFYDGSKWNWANFFGSRLFWVAIAFAAAFAIAGVVAGRRIRRPFEGTPGSRIALIAAFFFISCLVLGTLRGSIVNNIWWVIVVTLLATSFGLAVAVLADRAQGEGVAKALIFLPMAISFVGAGVIWKLIYQPKDLSKPQTGLLNALWVGLGELSDSSWQKWVVFLVSLAVVAFCGVVALSGIKTHNFTRSGFAIGCGLVVLILAVMLVTRGLGLDLPPVPDYVRNQPYNNMFLMVVLIWIQTGFAMVILSSAIKAVPTEFIEAASIDGATESQIFWRVTLPQLLPTIGVVVTTTIVTVMKVYDIIQVMTGGQNGTQVIAFQMIEQINERNSASAATYATLLFVAILPVMVYNIRNMRKEG